MAPAAGTLEDVFYAVAMYSTGLLTGLWAVALAPSPAQLVLEMLIVGWLRMIPGPLASRARG